MIRNPKRGDSRFKLPFARRLGRTFCLKVSARILKTSWACIVFFGVPLAAQAQFSYTTINGTFTITGYTGPGGSVTIPSSINGVMVTGLGDHAFDEFLGNTGPSSVTIPDTVSNIGNYV